MQSKNGSDNSQQSLGICQRLIKLLMNSFLGQSLKRVTMASSRDRMPDGSNEVLLENGSSESGAGEPAGKLDSGYQVNRNGNLGSEVIVDFRHINGIENWITFDNHTGDHPLIEKDDFEKWRKGKEIDHQVVGNGIESTPGKEITTLPRGQGTYIRETNPFPDPRHGKGPKSLVSIKERELEKKKNLDDHKVPPERLTLAIQPEHIQFPRPPRHLRPLLGVASNINEKSDEFIRWRKEAMSKISQP